MKGTEKQIKWAEDIIRETREANKQHVEFYTAKVAENDRIMVDDHKKCLHIWEAISAEFERTVSGIDSAAVVIDNRKLLSADRMQWYFNELSLGHLKGFPGM